MKLELKHLAPYLPYKLEYIVYEMHHTLYAHDLSIPYLEKEMVFNLKKAKPILRPLSDLTKEIEHNGEKFYPLNELTGAWPINTKEKIDKYGLFGVNGNQNIGGIILTYDDCQKLFEYHFDVFGLIEAGLAINMNEIRKEEVDELSKDIEEDTTHFNKMINPED